MEFKKGDIVSFGGSKGTVIKVTAYSILVNFDFTTMFFTPDGRFDASHTEPLLKLIERPKRKKKIKRKVWINVYENNYCIHDDECVAKKSASTITKPIAIAVPTTIEYEIDDD